MSSERGGRRNRGHHSNKKVNIGDKGKEVSETIKEDSPVIQQFRAYTAELDEKHDRFERIVKIKRDITIESKRIIFLLHTIDTENKQDKVLNEAKLRFDNMGRALFKLLASELDNQDVYEYVKAYRGGLEEYIEAVTFYQYLREGTMQDWTELEKSLCYTDTDKSEAGTECTVPQGRTISVLISPYEYILGIADLTGELMRKCINNLATGDIDSCYQTCNFVRNMYKGFLGCTTNSKKEISRKLYTLRQSLSKMENVCYTIKVRGSEIPKHILADVANEEYNDYGDEVAVYQSF